MVPLYPQMLVSDVEVAALVSPGGLELDVDQPPASIIRPCTGSTAAAQT